jgi:hypothetical protein
MLKIWLTWLQPSLGVLGTALVLSNPLCSYAATTLAVANSHPKAPTVPPQWSSVKFTGTNIDKALLKGIAATPDQAIRQLAINTMVTSGLRPSAVTAKVPQNFGPLSNFIETPANFQPLAAKATKPQQVKQAVSLAAAKTTNPAKTLVPGLLIGTGNVQVSNQVLPTIKPVTRTVSATVVAAPVQLTAVVPTTTVASPFPVVRPELMQQIEANPVIASVKEIKTASLDLQSIGSVSAGLPSAADTAALNPIASIPAGLQQLLGNNFDSGTRVVATPVAKATGPNFRSMAALTQLVSPAEKVAPATVTMSSLQLATAQSYASVPKFSIPGETTVAAKPARPVGNVLTVQPVKKSVTTATVAPQNNYVALMSSSRLTLAARQSWTAVSQSSNLGGLILGSQQLVTLPNVISLVPMNPTKTTTFTGSTVSDLSNIN